MGGKPRISPKLSLNAEFLRVEELAHARIASAIRSGYTIRRSHWSIAVGHPRNSSSKYGACCAVGAIAFDGEQPNWIADGSVFDDTALEETYALGGAQLKKIGVDPIRFSAILDSISSGFEGHAAAPVRYSECLLPARELIAFESEEQESFQRYVELGQTLWELYGR